MPESLNIILGYNLTKKTLSSLVFAPEINLSYLSFVLRASYEQQQEIFFKKFFMK